MIKWYKTSYELPELFPLSEDYEMSKVLIGKYGKGEYKLVYCRSEMGTIFWYLDDLGGRIKEPLEWGYIEF